MKKLKRFELIIPGAATPKGRPRTRTILREDSFGQVTKKKTWTYSPKGSSEYAEMARVISWSARQEAGFELIPYPKPVRLVLKFILKRRATATPDLPNLVVQLCDVLEEAGLYSNDSQVVELRVAKAKGKYPMTYVSVEEL